MNELLQIGYQEDTVTRYSAFYVCQELVTVMSCHVTSCHVTYMLLYRKDAGKGVLILDYEKAFAAIVNCLAKVKGQTTLFTPIK